MSQHNLRVVPSSVINGIVDPTPESLGIKRGSAYDFLRELARKNALGRIAMRQMIQEAGGPSTQTSTATVTYVRDGWELLRGGKRPLHPVQQQCAPRSAEAAFRH